MGDIINTTAPADCLTWMKRSKTKVSGAEDLKRRKKIHNLYAGSGLDFEESGAPGRLI